MKLKVGQALASRTDSTNVVVVRIPEEEIELSCGGISMVDAKSHPKEAEKVAASDEWLGETLVGKRYVSADEKTEVLCTRPGSSALSVNGVAMTLKAAKSLPASD